VQEKPSETADRAVRQATRHSGGGGDSPIAPVGLRRRKRTDWRLGGRAVSRWDWTVLVASLVGVGFGVLAALGLTRLGAAPGSAFSLVGLWSGLAGAVAFAFIRSRPARLLRFQPTDMLWGVGLGLLLRLAQGLLSQSDMHPFPSSSSMSISDIVLICIAGPMLEEALFRALLVVAIYQALRRSVGAIAGGITAALVSAGAFVCLHTLFANLTLADCLQLFALGLSCALVLLLTGRIWGAILMHVTYNVTFVLLGLIGAATM